MVRRRRRYPETKPNRRPPSLRLLRMIAQQAQRRLCGEVGLVIRLHLLFGEVRSVTAALKVVEEVQEGLQEIERE